MSTRGMVFGATLGIGLMSGCGEAANSGANYVEIGIQTKEAAKAMAAQLPMDHLVRSFQAKNGRNPQSLEELQESEGKLPNPPEGKVWKLDAEQGTLKLVPAPPPPQ